MQPSQGPPTLPPKGYGYIGIGLRGYVAGPPLWVGGGGRVGGLVVVSSSQYLVVVSGS